MDIDYTRFTNKFNYKPIENFLKRLALNLGNTPSQSDVKVISCIPIDVTELQQKITKLEYKLKSQQTIKKSIIADLHKKITYLETELERAKNYLGDNKVENAAKDMPGENKNRELYNDSKSKIPNSVYPVLFSKPKDKFKHETYYERDELDYNLNTEDAQQESGPSFIYHKGNLYRQSFKPEIVNNRISSESTHFYNGNDLDVIPVKEKSEIQMRVIDYSKVNELYNNMEMNYENSYTTSKEEQRERNKYKHDIQICNNLIDSNYNMNSKVNYYKSQNNKENINIHRNAFNKNYRDDKTLKTNQGVDEIKLLLKDVLYEIKEKVKTKNSCSINKQKVQNNQQNYSPNISYSPFYPPQLLPYVPVGLPTYDQNNRPTEIHKPQEKLKTQEQLKSQQQPEIQQHPQIQQRTETQQPETQKPEIPQAGQEEVEIQHQPDISSNEKILVTQDGDTQTQYNTAVDDLINDIYNNPITSYSDSQNVTLEPSTETTPHEIVEPVKEMTSKVTTLQEYTTTNAPSSTSAEEDKPIENKDKARVLIKLFNKVKKMRKNKKK